MPSLKADDCQREIIGDRKVFESLRLPIDLEPARERHLTRPDRSLRIRSKQAGWEIGLGGGATPARAKDVSVEEQEAGAGEGGWTIFCGSPSGLITRLFFATRFEGFR